MVAQGAPDSLLAIASLSLADGRELVEIPVDGSHRAQMEEQYFQEQVGAMPGSLYQSIRRGTFTHVYPHAPGQLLPPGPAVLEIASTATSGSVDVSLLMPPDDGGSILHVNVIGVSDSFSLSEPPPFMDEVNAIFAQAGITVVLDQVVSQSGTGFERITDFSEPQEAPTSMSAQLALVGLDWVDSDALPVFIVDALPFGVAGLSLGTPGPPLPGSSYYGVVLRGPPDAPGIGRVFAHEVAHFLALQHIANTGISGAVYPDPLDDTEPGQDNLMEDGTVLSSGQQLALTRSFLLAVE
jgi:hypothetical protein